MAVWRNIVDCANINLMRDSIDECLSERLGILEAQVATVDIVRQRERELTLMEVRRVSAIIKRTECIAASLHHLAVADPFEHELVWENALIVNPESILIEK